MLNTLIVFSSSSVFRSSAAHHFVYVYLATPLYHSLFIWVLSEKLTPGQINQLTGTLCFLDLRKCKHNINCN